LRKRKRLVCNEVFWSRDINDKEQIPQHYTAT
jgi:hypothetical protein